MAILIASLIAFALPRRRRNVSGLMPTQLKRPESAAPFHVVGEIRQHFCGCNFGGHSTKHGLDWTGH